MGEPGRGEGISRFRGGGIGMPVRLGSRFRVEGSGTGEGYEDDQCWRRCDAALWQPEGNHQSCEFLKAWQNRGETCPRIMEAEVDLVGGVCLEPMKLKPM